MGWQSLSEKLQLFANWNWKSFVGEERRERRGRGGRVSISSRWSYWSMGARARTSIHTWIHGNGPSWSMLVMVNYHVSRTPTSPSSRLSARSIRYHRSAPRNSSDFFTPISLSNFSLFLSFSFSIPSVHSSIVHFSHFSILLLAHFFLTSLSRWLHDFSSKGEGKGARSSQFLLIFYFFFRSCRVAKRETHGTFLKIGILFMQKGPVGNNR